MRKSPFNEEQIIGIPKESEAGMTTPELCRKHEIASQTLYRWKGEHVRMEVSEATRPAGVGRGEPAVEAHGG